MASRDMIEELGLTRLLNASGTETVYGASPVHPEIIEAVAGILPHSVDMAELQRAASRAIEEATGAEAGFVTGCTSAGIVISVAACMTGLDLARIERLPDTDGLKNEVVIQKGHVVNYGSSITGDIRLSGARVVEFGAAMETGAYQLEAALGAQTAAAVYVVSHHAAPTGMIPLPRFIEICHARGVPVVVDAAAEYGWREFLSISADLVLFSAQKALGSLTAGIVAGRRDLVRAAYAQSRGIGRPMKAGKEAVVGTIAALRRWTQLDQETARRDTERKAATLAQRLSGLPGISAVSVADETGNPFSRLHLTIDAAVAGFSAHGVAVALSRAKPRVLVRTLHADRGVLMVDVRRLDDAGLDLVCRHLQSAIDGARAAGDRSMPPPPGDGSARAVLEWLAEPSE
ncbi:MAG: aminotransferase class V-fold PLP-dependent enzyme [Parvibaculaceae bacterium]